MVEEVAMARLAGPVISATREWEFANRAASAVQAQVEPNEVQIWAVLLDVTPEQRRAYESLLSPAERARAQRFRFDCHRARFIVSRGVLRTILGSSLGLPPEQVEFAYGPFGKPALAGNCTGVEFNLAHSEDLALVALSMVGPVGVDIEKVRPVPDMDELVARFFSPRESAEFRGLSSDQKPEAFFNLWTRKEALLKATGQGIAHCLARVEVTFGLVQPASIRALPPEFGQRSDWVLHDLRLAPGAVGAVAAKHRE